MGPLGPKPLDRRANKWRRLDQLSSIKSGIVGSQRHRCSAWIMTPSPILCIYVDIYSLRVYKYIYIYIHAYRHTYIYIHIHMHYAFPEDTGRVSMSPWGYSTNNSQELSSSFALWFTITCDDPGTIISLRSAYSQQEKKEGREKSTMVISPVRLFHRWTQSIFWDFLPQQYHLLPGTSLFPFLTGSEIPTFANFTPSADWIPHMPLFLLLVQISRL